MKTTREPGIQVFTTNSRLGALSQRALKRLGATARSASLHRMDEWPTGEWPMSPGGGRLLVVSSLGDIPEKPTLPHDGKSRRHLVFKDDLPSEATTRIAKLRSSHIHVAGKLGKAQEYLLQRLLLSYLAPGVSLIIDAWWEKEEFVALSADYAFLRIPAAKLAPWLGTSRAKLEVFDVDSDGSFVHWPHVDAHFGWDELRYLIDPAAVAAARQRRRQYDAKYGEAIKKVRLAHHLAQSAIPGLSSRHVRRVENGSSRATSKFLRAMAAAHSLPVNQYLDLVARAM